MIYLKNVLMFLRKSLEKFFKAFIDYFFMKVHV